MTNESLSLYATLAQAASAIAAILISSLAIIIPNWQQRERNKKEDRERRLKAKCLATAIRFSLHDIDVFLAKAKLTATGPSFQTNIPNVLPPDYQFSRIEIPAILSDNLDQLYLLDEPAGPSLLRLNAVLNSYNEAVDLQYHQSFTDPALPVSERWKRLIAFIGDIEPIVKEALRQITMIANQKDGF